MRSFGACFAGKNGSGLAGADTDSVADTLAGDGSSGAMGGASSVRRASPRPTPQLLQKFASSRLIAWQRGHSIANLTPHVSQK